MNASKDVPTINDPKIAVAMLGARAHYAVPRMLHNAGLLGRLYTDSYIGNKPALEALLRSVPSGLAPRALTRWLGRKDPALPRELVISFEMLGIKFAVSRMLAKGTRKKHEILIATSSRFCNAVVNHGLPDAVRTIWGFNTASLEIFRWAKSTGRRCVLEQAILPKVLERNLLKEVLADFPGWQPGLEESHAEDQLASREADEWNLADKIFVGSRFVADGLVSCGVPHSKIAVVPYGVDTSRFTARQPQYRPTGPLRILFVGEVGLRKGAPYLLQALGELGPSRVTAKFAGNVVLDRDRLRAFEGVADFLGAVPRVEMPALYKWADVFVLPSVIEGSAIASYEALLSGLPIITTPNSGTIVEQGKDGQIIPSRDSSAIAAALMKYIDNRAVLLQHSEAAVASREKASLDRYQRELLKALAAHDSSVTQPT